MAKRKTDGLKVQIATEELKKACARLKPIAAGTTGWGAGQAQTSETPGRAAVILEAEGDTLSLSAFDLEVGLTTTHAADVQTKGLIALPLKILKGLVDVAAENIVGLSALDNNRVFLQSGTLEAEIAGLDPEQVPSVDVPASVRFSDIDAAALLQLIDAVRPAICEDTGRPNLCGVRLERSRMGWVAVATDGHRMHVLDQKIDDGAAKALDTGDGVLLSVKTIQTLRAVLSEDDAPGGQLGFNRSAMCFKREGLDIVARLVDAEFPGWKDLIPETYKHEINVNRLMLQKAVARMCPVSNRAGHRTVIHVGKNVIRLRAESPDVGSVTDTIIVEHTGADVTLAANTIYLTDALETLSDADQVTLSVEDSLSPVVIRPFQNELSTRIVMPLRVEVGEESSGEDAAEDAKGETDIETVLPELRETFAAQDAKSKAMTQAQLLGKEAAKLDRKEKGEPIDRETARWPRAGFWEKAEAQAGRKIPNDEREAARNAYWGEATKPWPVKAVPKDEPVAGDGDEALAE